jgi:hypothetical protein
LRRWQGELDSAWSFRFGWTTRLPRESGAVGDWRHRVPALQGLREPFGQGRRCGFSRWIHVNRASSSRRPASISLTAGMNRSAAKSS